MVCRRGPGILYIICPLKSPERLKPASHCLHWSTDSTRMMINIWISGGRCIFVCLFLASALSPKCQSSHKLQRRGLNTYWCLAVRQGRQSFALAVIAECYIHLFALVYCQDINRIYFNASLLTATTLYLYMSVLIDVCCLPGSVAPTCRCHGSSHRASAGELVLLHRLSISALISPNLTAASAGLLRAI